MPEYDGGDHVDGCENVPSRLVRDIRGTLPVGLGDDREPAISDDGVDADQPLTEPSD